VARTSSHSRLSYAEWRQKRYNSNASAHPRAEIRSFPFFFFFFFTSLHLLTALRGCGSLDTRGALLAQRNPRDRGACWHVRVIAIIALLALDYLPIRRREAGFRNALAEINPEINRNLPRLSLLLLLIGFSSPTRMHVIRETLFFFAQR
jgi:hypothetical protein